MALADLLDTGFFRPRNVVPAVLALVVGVAAWFGIRPLLDAEAPAPAVVEAPAAPAPAAAPLPEPAAMPVYPYVLVARQRLESGVLVVAEQVEWLEWREPVDVTLAVVQDAVSLQAVLGAVTIRPFEQGEPLAWDGLILPGSPGFITAVLTPGRRAVTVEVDRATTLANIIYPGDRVDVILVADMDSGEASVSVAQGIVRDARVLAVGSTIMALGRYGKPSVTAEGLVHAVTPPDGETYTLEVVPKDAARIALAANKGGLTLAVRPIFGRPTGSEDAMRVQFGEVMQPLDAPVEPPRVRVIRGGVDDEAVILEGG